MRAEEMINNFVEDTLIVMFRPTLSTICPQTRKWRGAHLTTLAWAEHSHISTTKSYIPVLLSKVAVLVHAVPKPWGSQAMETVNLGMWEKDEVEVIRVGKSLR